jgi:transposase
MSIDIDDFSDKLHEYKNKSHKRKYENIKLRRELVELMFSRFYNKREIAELLGVDQQTVTRDIQWLKSAAKKEMTEKMEKKYPGEYRGYSVVIDELLRLAWDFALIEKLITGRLHINL